MADFETEFPHPKTGEKHPAVWTEKYGITHRAVGSQIIPFDRGTFIMWTACGKKDIPTNAANLQRSGELVTCDDCKRAEAMWEEDARAKDVAHSQFGVGA